MRIATSTTYAQQATAIDNLSSQYQNVGQQLSGGKRLTAPSDDPSVIAQDLTLSGTINAENGDASNAQAAQNQLTFTDAALSQLTDVLSSARALTVTGANDIIPNGAQRPLIGKQVEGLLEQALGLANSQFGGQYIFGGTGASTTPPVVQQGSPPSGNIIFNGNLDTQKQVINGQTVTTGTTLQQAFNYSATNGSPSVFQVLATLRNTLNQEPASIESQGSINSTGQTIYGPGSPVQTTLGQLAATGGPSVSKLVADNAVPVPPATGYFSIQIDGTTNSGTPGSSQFTFTNADTVSTILAKLNAQTATTGVTAAWNQATQRLTLTSVSNGSPPFEINDIPTPANGAGPGSPAVGATNTSNFLAVFQIPNQVSVTSNLSTQLHNIDVVINAVQSARAQLGQQLQNLSATGNQIAAQTTDNKSVASGYEDTNVAQATSQFSLVQTALQAAYAVTTRLEGKSLLDYLP